MNLKAGSDAVPVLDLSVEAEELEFAVFVLDLNTSSDISLQKNKS
jgi:hypothetical protein